MNNVGVGLEATLPNEPMPRERLPIISGLLFVFVVGAASVTMAPDWNNLVKVLGVILAIFTAITAVQTRFVPTPEMILYLVWLVWSLTGLVGATNAILFWMFWITVFQVWVLLFIMSNYAVSRRTLSFSMFALLVGFAIVAGYSLITGEYAAAEHVAEARVAGLAMNANEFAWLMVLATATMAYFWMLPTRLGGVKYLLLATGMAGAAVACVLSGSRTGLVGLMAFYPVWIWFCYRKDVFRRPKVFAIVLLGLTVGGYLFLSYLSSTAAGERMRSGFHDLRTMGAAAPSSGIRLLLFRRALEVTADHPLTGVGLGNFMFFSGTGHVSHSEYAELLCTTGVPGFILYFAIFVVLWRRAGKIAKYSDDPYAITVARFTRALLVVVLLMDLGRWNYYNKVAWIVFGGLIGYTSAVWQVLKHRVAERDGLPVAEAAKEQRRLRTSESPV